MAASDNHEKRLRDKSSERIRRAVEKAGRMSLRDLKRATNYNRHGEAWFVALDELERAGKIRFEQDGSFRDWVVWVSSRGKSLKC